MNWRSGCASKAACAVTCWSRPTTRMPWRSTGGGVGIPWTPSSFTERTLAEMPFRFAILTVSDRSARGERADLAGPALADTVRAKGGQVVRLAVVPDERKVLEETLSAWSDQKDLDILLTTGGTGFSPRDITPEATRAVIEREAPGLVEAMRQESLKTTPHAMLSRAVAGIRGTVLIINLP